MSEIAIIRWVPDHAVRNCEGCMAEFSMWRRRHHCRECGQIFCDDCSSHRKALPNHMGHSRKVRVCNVCIDTPDSQPSNVSQTNTTKQSRKVVIGKHVVPEKYKEKADRVVNDLLKFANAKDGEYGLVKLGEAKNPEMSWFCRYNPDPKKPALTLARCRLPCSPRLGFELYEDNEFSMKIEPMLQSVKDLEELDHHTTVVYVRTNPVMIISARDILYLDHWRVFEDGTIVIANFSIDSHPAAPITDSYVRCYQESGGCVIKPIPGSPDECEMIMLMDADMMLGDLPGWVMKQINAMNASMMSDGFKKFAVEAKRRQRLFGHAKGPLVNVTGQSYSDNVEIPKEELSNSDSFKSSGFMFTYENVLVFFVGIMSGIVLVLFWLSANK